MAADQNINQFKFGRAIGDLDLSYFGGDHVISCRFDPTETDKLHNGEAVMLMDLSGDDVEGPPIVGLRTGDTSKIFGFKIRSLKKGVADPGDMVDIAIKGAVMFLKTTGVLSRGAVLAPLFVASPGSTNQGSVQAKGVKAYAGYLLDKAGGAEIRRVMIDCDGITAGSTT